MFNFIKAYPRHAVFLDSHIIGLAAESFFKGRLYAQELISGFERAFANYVHTKEAIAVSSGRLGLYLILKGFNYPPGSEIILSAYNFHPVVSVIIGAGLKPVFVDIDPFSFNIDASKIEDKLSPESRAILVTHMFGNPCDMDVINKIAKSHNLHVIEDAAHGFGSEWRGQKAGGLGDAAFFSLSQGKNIVSFGGGIITTSNKERSEKIRNSIEPFPPSKPKVIIKNIIKTYISFIVTTRPLFSILLYPILRLCDCFCRSIIEKIEKEKVSTSLYIKNPCGFSGLQAAVGIYQISRMGYYIDRKKQIIEYLDRCLNGLDGVCIQHRSSPAKNYKLYYSVYLQNRTEGEIAKIRSRLLREGVDTQFTDMRDCSSLQEFAAYGCECPNARMVAPRIFEIPSDISLHLKDLDNIIQIIKKVCEMTKAG